MQKTVEELAKFINGKVIGDGQMAIEGITNMEMPLEKHITFVQDEKTFRRLEASPLACLIVPKKIEASSKVLIQVEHPKLAWAKLLHLFFPPPVFNQEISKQAFIAETAKIGKKVTLEPFAIVSDHAVVGDGAVIRSHSFVGEHVQIGSHSFLHVGVAVYPNCQIGSSVIIHAGSVIGSDGFGYVATGSSQEKVPQVGSVIIEDNVEIGACVTVDRATVGSTRIGKGTKIDNLVQIAHNVLIGPHSVISAQTGISGSCKIGAHVTMGGKVGVGDHVEIGDGTMVGAGSGLPSGKKVPARQIVFGEPARPYPIARRQIAAQQRTAEMYDDIKNLKKRLAELEKKIEESLKK